MGFKTSLWQCLVVVVLSMSVLVIIFKELSSNLMKIKHQLNVSKVVLDLLSIMFTSTSIPDYSIPGSGLLFIGWAGFCLIISQLYSTDLILHLTIPRFEKRIDTNIDFVKSNLSWGLFRLTYFEYLNLELEVDREIKNRFQIEKTSEVRLNGIRNNNYAVLVYNFDGSAVCLEGFDQIPVKNLRLMKNSLSRPYIAFGFPQNSPFRETIDYHVLRLFESGIAQHIKLQEIRTHQKIIWQSVSYENDRRDQFSNEPEVLTLPQLHGAFLVLIVGCFLGLIAFVIENLWAIKRWKKHG